MEWKVCVHVWLTTHSPPNTTPYHKQTIDHAGSGLGRLLFFQLFATLRRQWQGHLGLLKLEAEEDTRRHDRLVRYYQSLGFRPTPDARVLYLSHQDACFRCVVCAFWVGVVWWWCEIVNDIIHPILCHRSLPYPHPIITPIQQGVHVPRDPLLLLLPLLPPGPRRIGRRRFLHRRRPQGQSVSQSVK